MPTTTAVPEKGDLYSQGTRSWLVRLLRLWTGESGSPTSRHAIFLVALSLICGAAIFIGVPRLVKYNHDVFLFLDGGWRILHGQRPHVDFFTGIGPVTYLVNALGLVLADMHPAGLGVGSGIVGMVVGLWAYSVALRRTYPGAAALAALVLTLLAVAPYTLGERPIDTGLACIYNRYGAAILGIVLIETYRSSRGRVSRFSDGLSTGLACGLLLFLKISFFCGAIPLVALAIFYGQERFKYLKGLSTGCAAVALPMLWYLRFDLAAMWRDVLEMALARRGENSPAWALAGSFFDWMSLALLVGLLYATRCVADPDVRAGWLHRREAVYAVVVVLVGILLLVTSHQDHGMPLNSILAILIAGNISLSGLGSRQLNDSVLLRGALVMLALSLVLATAMPDLLSLGFSVHRQARGGERQLPQSQTFHTPRLAGMWVAGTYPQSETEEYIREIEDGIGMIERLSPPSESVFSLDFTSPFSYALGRPPAHGGAWSLHYKMGIDERHHPSPEFAIGGANILMEPKFPTADLAGILGIYGDYLKSHFHFVAESSCWRMYRRNL